MSPWRHKFLVVLFFSLCAGVGIYSAKIQLIDEFAGIKDIKPLPKEQESYFSTADFYVLKDFKEELQLSAEELMLETKTQKSSFKKPSGFFYTKSREKVLFDSEFGFYRPSSKSFTLQDEIEIKTSQIKLKSDKANYVLNKDFFSAEGNVETQNVDARNGDHVYVKALQVQSWPKLQRADYLGKVEGHIERKRKYEPDVFFNADSIHLDMLSGHVGLEGQVFVKRQDVEARSLRGEIYLENTNKKLKYYSLFDDVKVIEKIATPEGQILERKAFGEKLEGIISDNILIFTGSPRVFQEDDVVKGNRIILRENNQVIEVEDASSNFILRKKKK